MTVRPSRPRLSSQSPPDPGVDRILADLSPGLRAIATRLRRAVRAAAPHLAERVKWGSPVWVGHRDAICLMIYSDHVNLGLFQGASLGRRFREIEGTGKSLRHVKVRTVAEAGRPILARMIRAASRLDGDAGAPKSGASRGRRRRVAGGSGRPTSG